jgi:hypothetical protein
VRRIRWSDPESEDPSTPIEWRAAAAIMATLFLNFVFWNGVGDRFWVFCPVPIYLLFLAGVTSLTTVICFGGPAAATLAAQRRLSGTIENSLGSFPTIAVRVIAAGFLIYWIGKSIALPVWWLASGRRLDQGPHPLLVPFTAAVVLFLVVTGSQSLCIQGRLAWFTNRLAVAVLVAALIRVRGGWYSVPDFWQPHVDRSWFWDGWRGFTELITFAAPLGLLAADLAPRLHARGKVGRACVAGVAIPLFGALLLVGVIDTATYASPFYQPSLNANVFMALWSKAASSALLPRMMVVTITAFGAARFGVKALGAAVSPGGMRSTWKVAAFVCASTGIVWSAIHPYSPRLDALAQLLARCLGVTSAIITADFLMRRPLAATPRINWVGCAAFLIGVGLPWYTPHGPMELSPNPWWYPWLLPSYAVAFTTCIVGRTLERAIRTKYVSG